MVVVSYSLDKRVDIEFLTKMIGERIEVVYPGAKGVSINSATGRFAFGDCKVSKLINKSQAAINVKLDSNVFTFSVWPQKIKFSGVKSTEHVSETLRLARSTIEFYNSTLLEMNELGESLGCGETFRIEDCLCRISPPKLMMRSCWIYANCGLRLDMIAMRLKAYDVFCVWYDNLISPILYCQYMNDDLCVKMSISSTGKIQLKSGGKFRRSDMDDLVDLLNMIITEEVTF